MYVRFKKYFITFEYTTVSSFVLNMFKLNDNNDTYKYLNIILSRKWGRNYQENCVAQNYYNIS